MAVPLLPHNLMGAMYEDLLSQRFNFGPPPNTNYTLFNKFKRYVRSTWMSQNYETLSVFGLERRTNNACETYHKQFNTLVERSHPGAYHFADFTNEMLDNYYDNFVRLKENPGVPIVRPIPPGQEFRMAKIRQDERRLKFNQFSHDSDLFVYNRSEL